MTTPAKDAFQEFHNRVVSDPELFDRLRAARDDETFAALAVEAGRERGLHFDVAEVRARMSAARRVWLKRGQ